MTIETLDDFLEQLADKLWIYGEKRISWIIEKKAHIDRSLEVENKLK